MMHWSYDFLVVSCVLYLLHVISCMEYIATSLYYFANHIPQDDYLLSNGVTFHALTYWGREKKASSFADDNFIRIFLNETIEILLRISMKHAPEG